MGEAIKNALYGDVPVSQLSEEQKQTLVALGTVAAGLAGGLAGDSAADTVAGAQAGQNEISNNMVGMGMLQQMLAQETLNSAAMAEAGKGGANEQAALALTKAVKEGLGAACLANDACVLMAVVAAQQHTNGAGSKTETVPVNDDLTGGKLVNPGQDESKGTSLITPDQSGDQGTSNTGNTDGAPDTGGNTTITPIPEQNKDDLAYLAEGYEQNKDAVGNMGEFLKQPGFGSTVKDSTQKTNQQYQGQSIYKATENIGDYIKKGDQFYLDGLHKDHMEVFDKRGNFRAVLNLDGSINERKTQEAEGRKLK